MTWSIPILEALTSTTNSSSFLDAKEPLLKAALIDRSSETESLTIHRLIQAAVMKRLLPDERIQYFDVTIAILSNGFPNTWNTVTSHQFTAWAKCEQCLPHVNFLIEQSKKYSLKASDPKKLSELILRCCWCVPVYVCKKCSCIKSLIEV
jgi:hypothetical protein